MSEQISAILKAIDDQGTAFDALKKSFGEQLAEIKKSGAVDPVLDARIKAMEKSIDDAIELKSKLEAGFAAERKEREDLEALLAKHRELTAQAQAALAAATALVDPATAPLEVVGSKPKKTGVTVQLVGLAWKADG